MIHRRRLVVDKNTFNHCLHRKPDAGLFCLGDFTRDIGIFSFPRALCGLLIKWNAC
ncbi:hypothetical protein QUF61_00100 [Candidatus Venteria ishoeyi]|uniref:hypothetical protein n=1 Tax=Candidatus Venteria ishoeyi TaxID=1899563 RepID=UPI0025A65EFB|nr:hypothetical protein [Candidatus Venteria ishoeyi]MDM8544870.1 hypothetical protein [Candidatus Venteria ishoeyi]